MSTQRRTIRTLSHCFYDCKYHIVFTPRYRGKIFKDKHVKQELDRIIKLICKWKKFELLELSIQEDHVHLCLVIPPRHSISYTMSIIKGKSSAWVKKTNKKTLSLSDKGSFWARGYFVSTIGIDEHLIRRYVSHQEKKNQIDAPTLFDHIKL